MPTIRVGGKKDREKMKELLDKARAQALAETKTDVANVTVARRVRLGTVKVGNTVQRETPSVPSPNF